MLPGASVVDSCIEKVRALYGMSAPRPREREASLWDAGLFVEAERRFLCRFAGVDPERAPIAWAALAPEERARILKAWNRVEALVDRVRHRITRPAGGPECRR